MYVNECFSCFIIVCSQFGIPLAHDETIPQCHSLEFLGITLDTLKMEFRLLQEKLAKTRLLVARMLQVKKTTLRELQSLLGSLCFASKVIPMRRVFSRCLYMATEGLKHPGSHICLGISLRKDLHLWRLCGSECARFVYRRSWELLERSVVR